MVATRSLLWLVVGSALFGVAVAGQPRATRDAWSPEVGEVLAELRKGEFERVRELSIELAQRSTDPRVRRDAVALRAAALMRMSARADRQDGRGLIAALAAESPEIIARPEVLLAGGIAAAALAETAVSLEQLDAAARGFAALDQSERRREALVALAETWALHTEWERTPPQFGIAAPADEAEKLSIRRKRMVAIAEELEARDDAEGAGRVRLALAALELRSGDAAAGAAALQNLAAAGPPNLTAARAALSLAEWHAAAERWAEAAAQYERLAGMPFPELAEEARRRLVAVRDGAVELTVARRMSSGERGALRLRARNIAALSIEIRAVDLGPWLDAQQGRFIENKLPESGALLASAELETRASQPHGWWLCSTDQTDRLTASLPPSPVLIVARWKDAGGEPRVLRRFAVVHGPLAGLAVGTEHACIWVSDAAQPASARFWMFGSFVPVRVALSAGAATFRLPPEARLLRDRRWSCLVEQGGRATLMTGELPEAPRSERGALQAAVLTAPVTPIPGDELRVAGLLVSDRPHAALLRIELRDALENLVADGQAAVQAEGLFESAIHVPDAAQGKTLRVVVLAGERLVESLMGPIMVRVGWAAESPIQLRIAAPSQVAADVASFPVAVTAWYPWGAPAGGGHVLYSRQTVEFPGESRGFSSHVRVSEHVDLDAQGQARLVATPAQLRARSPAGVRFTFSAGDDSGFGSSESAVTLIAAERPTPWIMVEPSELQVGRSCGLTLNLLRDARENYEPETLIVRSPSGQLRALPLFITDRGWRASPWIPQEAGRHTIIGPPYPSASGSVPIESVVDVVADSEHAVCGVPLDVSAACDPEVDASRVKVRVVDQKARTAAAPVAILTSATDVLGAAVLDTGDGQDAIATIDAPVDPRGLRVSVVSLCGDGPHVHAVAPVVAQSALTAAPELTPVEGPVAPGADVGIAISGHSLDDAAADVAVVRLVRLPTIDGIFSLGGERRDVGLLAASAACAFTADGAGAVALGEARLAAAVHDALAGPANWLATTRLDSAAKLSFRAPQRPGNYELQAVVRSPDGALRALRTPLRVASPLRVTLGLPPRLLVGDRCLVSLAIEHAGSPALPLRIRILAGELLEAGELRAAGQTAISSAAGWVALEAPGGGVLCVTASAEAVREGAGSVVAEVEVAGRVETHRVRVQIQQSDVSKTPAPISVRRTTYRAVPEILSEADAQAAGLAQAERWTLRRELVDPATVFQPGELMLVQEEVALASPLPESEWDQAFAAGFLPARDEGRPLPHTIGTERRRPGGASSYATPVLPAGIHRHEYLMKAAWPGTFSLPPPEVRTGSRRAVVRLEAEDTRLRIGVP